MRNAPLLQEGEQLGHAPGTPVIEDYIRLKLIDIRLQGRLLVQKDIADFVS